MKLTNQKLINGFSQILEMDELVENRKFTNYMKIHGHDMTDGETVTPKVNVFGHFIMTSNNTPIQECNLDRKLITDKESTQDKFVKMWIAQHYNKDSDEENGSLEFLRAEAIQEFFSYGMDEYFGECS